MEHRISENFRLKLIFNWFLFQELKLRRIKKRKELSKSALMLQRDDGKFTVMRLSGVA